MEFTLEELTNKGFKPFRLDDGSYLRFSGGDGTFLLAKKSVDNLYEMHGAQDCYGKNYSSEDLSGFDFEDFSVNQFINFIHEPEEIGVKV